MVKTPVQPTQSISLEQFLAQPETKPASEYINGKIYQKPMPQAKHSMIQGELVTTINAVAKSQKVAIAFPELRCRIGDRAIVPDVVVLEYENIPRDAEGNLENVVNQAPDWTIEILSPDQSVTRVIDNILYCLNHGCRLGWLIDPEAKTILIFQSQAQPIFVETGTEDKQLVTPDFLPNLQLTANQIFDWLQKTSCMNQDSKESP
ncbi:Uma2 family endonuclease [[Limnothrix rosea] IAM M-220]|uniref:Uma2 family endonuclease n=1 Tax=[Limnothrix rosea] IAM M-220 TaxID=454133 RepID=UPI0009613E0C|nr:Uma2 family endonuclease [[Limnothrix rosea] IAM M-220]OKH11155.1 hypothetical protein NIES208_17700 [[Limnothrix rosea] IAM M-220]